MSDFHRIKRLPPYVFEQVNRIKAAARANGADIIDLGMGNPDLAAPQHVIDKLVETVGKPRTDRYSASKGIAGLRRAQAAYYERRFGVKLNPDTQVVATLGSKEGFANMAQAITAPGDVVLVPNPSYPIHAFGFLMAGGVIRSVPAEPTPDFFPAAERAVAHSIPKPIALVVCYPSNPTAYVASLDFYRDLVAFAKKHELILLSDLAYAEVYFDDRYPPPSVLQVPGAMDVAVEFTSMSKTFSMAGWRIGFAVGNERLLAALARVKSYLDYGAFTPVQVAATAALNGPEDCIREMRATYKRRRDVLVESFGKAGWPIPAPTASMFAWVQIPEKFRPLGSLEFSKLLVEKADVAVAPGIGFGEHGDDYVRIALVENEQRIRQAARNIRKFFDTADQTLHNVVPDPAPGVASLAMDRTPGALVKSGRVSPGAFSVTEALRVGVAGLGTVGASVIRILARQDNALTAAHRPSGPRDGRVGPRPGEGSWARSLRPCTWFDDPVALARSDGGGLRRRTGRRRGRRRKATVETAIASASMWSPPTRRSSPKHGLALAKAAESQGRRTRLRGIGRRRHPGHQDACARPCRQYDLAALRHPQRHLQLHPFAHGARRADLRGMPQGRPAPRLCGGRSDLRRGRLRHRPQARHPRRASPSAPRSTPMRSTWRASRRSRPSTSRWRRNSATASSCSASPSAPRRASSSGFIRPWCRAPPPSRR